MIGLVSCQKRVVAFHIILGTPIGKIAARMREDVSLLHRPTRSGLFPFVPGKCFVLVSDSSVDVLPNLIHPMEIISALYEIAFRMLRQPPQNFLSRSKDKFFVRFIHRHYTVPLGDSICTSVVRPKRHRVIPIQVVGLLGINLRVSGSPKNQKEYGDE